MVKNPCIDVFDKQWSKGAVLSPSFSISYMPDLPIPPNDVKVMSYADDVSIYATGTIIENLVA